MLILGNTVAFEPIWVNEPILQFPSNVAPGDSSTKSSIMQSCVIIVL